jgi:phage shock protein PspC (stress-responsive transcriptional regulator)
MCTYGQESETVGILWQHDRTTGVANGITAHYSTDIVVIQIIYILR